MIIYSCLVIYLLVVYFIMKNLFLFPIILIIALLLTGCGFSKGPAMDQLAEDNNFHYQNKDLGFAIVLPVEFQYYQTQRKETEEFVDIEFFVPTSDTDYLQEVPGYAKPIVVRIFNQDVWQGVSGEDQALYQKLGDKGKRVWTIRFWQEAPIDWQDKWSEEMRGGIIKDFKVK